jgi:hypothetical protein
MRQSHRFASVLILALAPALMRCEPGDDVPPPATPTNPVAPASSNAAPAVSSTSDTAAQQDDETKYASGEYAVGEDSDAYDDNDPAALTDFRGALDPYGAWVDDPTYGTVWAPAPTAVGADFTPYVTAGHWVYDDDYVWVSDYPWGWAPFHYGRWVLVEGRGWVWVPGRVYRGAWVAWSVDPGYGYVGWAPAPLAFVWFGGVAVGWNAYVGPRWVYCPRNQVFAPAVGTRIVTGAAVAPVAARMHPYVTATPGVSSGPPPARLGYNATQVPHVTGAASPNLVRAQQFARPSTAQPLGASAPARVWATPSGASRAQALPAAHPTMTLPHVSSGVQSPSYRAPAAAPNAARPGAPAVHPPAPAVRAPSPPSPAPAPAFRGATPYSPGPGSVPHAAPAYGGGGGHHR